jgi:hypothetical protein
VDLQPTRLPTHKDVRDLLTARSGRTVTLAPAVPYAPAPGEPATYAVYVDPQMRTCAVAMCDLRLSVLAGAAAATIPVGGTEAEMESRSLAPTTEHHLHELLEALASLLEDPAGLSVRLHAMYPPGVEPPSDIPAYARAVGRRMDLEVAISAYGGGRFSLVCPVV